jgi:uncharacterized protein (PEP-CTERM system associated)
MPSRHISLQALGGSRYKTATLTLAPSARTTLTTSYRNRKVGRNPGPVWSGNLKHRTLHAVFEAGYLEDTVTNQQLAQELVVLQAPNPDPVTGEPLYLDIHGNPVPAGSPDIAFFNRFTLTDEIIVRQRASAGISYTRRKSTIRLSGFDEQRVYQSSLQEERVRGLDVSWTLKLTPRTQSLLTVGVQRNRVKPVVQQNEYYFIQMGLTHQLSRGITGGLEYRFFSQSSNDSSVDGYQENRLTARVTVRF